MESGSAHEFVRVQLERLGIGVPQEDIPFLTRAYLRQQDLLQRQADRLTPSTEPAHVFHPPAHGLDR